MSTLFQFQVSPWELILRASVVYWFLFLLFRFVLRRDAGSLGLADILLIVIIADASQNGLSGDYKTISEGLLLVSTIAAWNYFFDWMSYRFEWFSRFAEPPVLTLVQHGRLLGRNLRKELITEEELMSQLRQNGVEDLSEVRRAWLEPDGKISVVTRAGKSSGGKSKQVPGAG